MYIYTFYIVLLYLLRIQSLSPWGCKPPMKHQDISFKTCFWWQSCNHGSRCRQHSLKQLATHLAHKPTHLNTSHVCTILIPSSTSRGPLRKILNPQKGVWNHFPRGDPWHQRIAFRPLAACFGRVLEPTLRKSSLNPFILEPFCCQKKGIKNCIAKPTISQAQLSACFLCSHANPLFLCLNPLMNKNRSILSFSGKFRLVNLIFY